MSYLFELLDCVPNTENIMVGFENNPVLTELIVLDGRLCFSIQRLRRHFCDAIIQQEQSTCTIEKDIDSGCLE